MFYYFCYNSSTWRNDLIALQFYHFKLGNVTTIADVQFKRLRILFRKKQQNVFLRLLLTILGHLSEFQITIKLLNPR